MDKEKTTEAIEKAADVAHAVIDTAAEAAKDIATAPQPDWMHDHEQRDIQRFEAQQRDIENRFNEQNKIIAGLASKEDIAGLATEKSVRDLVHWQKNIVTTASILTGGSKWFYRSVLIIAPLVAAITIIFGGWKALVIWLLPK